MGCGQFLCILSTICVSLEKYVRSQETLAIGHLFKEKNFFLSTSVGQRKSLSPPSILAPETFGYRGAREDSLASYLVY